MRLNYMPMPTHNLVLPIKRTKQKNLYSIEEERAIARLVATGEYTRVALAAKLNIHTNTVKNICKRHPCVFEDVEAEKGE